MSNGGGGIPYYNDSDNGVLLFDKSEVLDGMGRDCQNLYTVPAGYGNDVHDCVGEKYVPELCKFHLTINPDDVAELRRKLVNGKSVGFHDKVPCEIIKYFALLRETDDVDRAISTLWNFIHKHRVYPAYWANSTVSLLYKMDGCMGLYSNYRSICESSIPGKMFEKNLATKVTKFLCNQKYPILNAHQGGF